MGVVSYLQLERTAGGMIGVNQAVIFDRVASAGGDRIQYDASIGEIAFDEAGYYYIDWFVAPQFGLTGDGSNFAIITSENEPALTGSSHVRVSPTIGFAVIEAAAPGKTVRLINTSDNSLTLSAFVEVKAALAVYSVAGPDTFANEE